MRSTSRQATLPQFLNGKQMRPILLFGEKRLAAFKDVPTSFELGSKVALPQFRAIVVRAGTPPDIVKKLSDALAKVYASESFFMMSGGVPARTTREIAARQCDLVSELK